MNGLQISIFGLSLILVAGCKTKDASPESVTPEVANPVIASVVPSPRVDKPTEEPCPLLNGTYFVFLGTHEMRVTENKIQLFYTATPDLPYATIPHRSGHFLKKGRCEASCIHGARFEFSFSAPGKVKVTKSGPVFSPPLLFERR